MHVKYLFAILFLILMHTVNAQTIHLGFDFGYGTYEMSENKKIIEKMMSSIEVQPHCVSNYPGYWFYRPSLEIKYQHLNTGIAYTLLSTGSRYSIRDYSGEYKFDVQNSGHTLAAFAETPVYSIEKFKFLLATEGGMVFNKMKLNESLQLFDTYSHEDTYTFESINFFLKPYLKVKYEIWDRIYANFTFGYHLDLKSNKMHLKEDDTNVTDFVSDWEGIRTSIGISYRMN